MGNRTTVAYDNQILVWVLRASSRQRGIDAIKYCVGTFSAMTCKGIIFNRAHRITKIMHLLISNPFPISKIAFDEPRVNFNVKIE